MMDIVDESRLPPPPPARLALLQENMEQRFPPAYLNFLQINNGAKPKTGTVKTANIDIVIDRFLPIVTDIKSDPQGWADIAVVVSQIDTRIASDPNMTGQQMIPIAVTPGGDFIVLDYRSAGSEPKVALWDHEMSDDFAPVTRAVADNFTAFLQLID